MKPYLLALCGGERSFEHDERITGRGRGVAVASLKGGRTVFASCRHNFINKVALSIYDKDRKSVEISERSLMLLIPTRDDLDLVLFVLPIPVSNECIRLSSQPIENNTVLYHAQNIVTNDQPPGSKVFAFSGAKTSKTSGRAICSFGDGTYELVPEDGGVAKAKDAGRQIFYSILGMKSRPGVSGSPLWDKYGTIRGMVCGGTGKDVSSPRLIYLPVRYMVRELKILLANEKK